MDNKLATLADKLTDTNFITFVSNKFHYSVEDMEGLCLVAKELAPLIRGEALCLHRPFSYEDKTCRAVFVTLGEGVDSLQEKYLADELLTEAFMVEALANELLLEAYKLVNDMIAQEMDYHVTRYHFMGNDDKLPLKAIPDVLACLNAPAVCNEAFCMEPKKSVVFLAELTKEEGAHCEAVCMGCNRADCPNRMEIRKDRDSWEDLVVIPRNYGASRIFSKR